MNRPDKRRATSVDNTRLRAALRSMIFDLHNCKYGGDQPCCAHIADALTIAREAIRAVEVRDLALP